MNILLSAYACHPAQGSEQGVGWKWLNEVSKRNKVWVLFYAGQGQSIAVRESVAQLPQSSSIHLLPIEVAPLIATRFYRIRYEVWQQNAYRVAQRLVQDEHIDLIHHVTIAAWWNCGHLWKLGIPFIFGPISGAQQTPKAAYPFLRMRDRLTERWRDMLFDTVWRSWRRPQQALRKASLVIAANPETEIKVREIRRDGPITLICEAGVDGGIHPIGRRQGRSDNVTHLLWAARLVPSKNFAFLLDVLKNIPHDVRWRLQVAGDGPLLQEYKKRTLVLGMESHIDFLGHVDFRQMTDLYMQADIFVFPSLREATGTVLLEAMSAGLPVIALNLHGARAVVDSSSGILINVVEREQMVDDFRSAIIRLCQDRQLRQQMGAAAQRRVESHFLWETRGKVMEELYWSVLHSTQAQIPLTDCR